MKLILGAMNFGPQVNLSDSEDMVNYFLNRGNTEIDSAYVYNNGETEKILGSIISKHKREDISIATKIHPRITGKLDSYAVISQFTESLARMRTDYVDILYFHFPDADTPIEDALIAINKLYESGKIKEFGLSNFPSWKVVDVWHKCNNNGWVCPTVYQGRYNALSRNVESELFPTLQYLNMRFYAYNPLAGGMLTGKHLSFEGEPQQGRFARLKSYRNRYWKKSYFDAVNIVISECIGYNIKPVEAAFRWLANHSLLDSKRSDGIILGASSINQLEQNLISIEQESLPEPIIEALENAWQEAKSESPEYFEFF
jgi:aflatoxin B1 aldehyde reductase